MAPLAAFDILPSNVLHSSRPSSNNNDNINNNPDLLYTQDSRQFQNLLSTLKITAEQETWLLDVILKRSVTMYRANATDEKKMIGKSMAILGKLDTGTSGDGVVPSQTLQACKAVQQNIAESSSDHLALEIFLRDTTYRNLNSAAKNRDSRLKERVKAIHSLLSKLESVEKAFIRALTDLKDEERKYNYLLGRKELDISEEIEKVEIDLRKCTSQMAIKQGEYDIVKSRLLDVQKSWKDEWHGFRIYTRSLELERKADIRNALLDLSRASILVKKAEIARQASLVQQLEGQDLLFDLANIHHFSPALLGQLDAVLPPSSKSDTIRTKLWPGGAPPLANSSTAGIPELCSTPSTSGRSGGGASTTAIVGTARRPPLDAEQLASISRPGRPPALSIRQRDAATYANYKSSTVMICDNGIKHERGDPKSSSAPPAFTPTDVPLSSSLSASSSASSSESSSSTSAASTPRSADFPVPPGSGRKSFDSPINPVVALSKNREYGEEMFSVPRKAVPKVSPTALDKYGRSATTPYRNLAETPTKSSTYRSPHRSPLDTLLFSSKIGNNIIPMGTATPPSDQGNDSSTPTAITASLLSNANTLSLVRDGALGGSMTTTHRKASKPLPGLPPGKLMRGDEERIAGTEEGQVGGQGEEATPPSLPSFSNLKLSEMRMSGMWFAQS